MVENNVKESLMKAIILSKERQGELFISILNFVFSVIISFMFVYSCGWWGGEGGLLENSV